MHHQIVLAMAGDHQDWRVRPALPGFYQQRETVHARHLDIGEDHVVVHGVNHVERRRGRVGRVHRHPVHSEA